MAARRRYFPQQTTEEDPYSTSQTIENDNDKPWDFLNTPREAKVGSAAESAHYNTIIKCLKLLTYITVFVVILASAIISKATTLLMTSQIRKNITRPYCNKEIDTNEQFIVTIPEVERVTWIWLLIFTYWIPELATFLRSLRKCLFKDWKLPTIWDFLSLLLTESCPAIGSALLIFIVIPELDVIKAAMLTNAVCFIPGFIALCSRQGSLDNCLLLILDVISTVAQASAFIIWPLIEQRMILYTIPAAVILISIGWWENYVSKDSPIPFVRRLGEIKKDFNNKTYFLYIFVSLMKCLLFFVTTLAIFWIREGSVDFLFDQFGDAFQAHPITVIEIEPLLVSDASPNYENAMSTGNSTIIKTDIMTAIWVFLINITTTYVCYAFGKFACKVMIQEFSFAFPINLSVPVLLTGLIAICGSYNRDVCTFTDIIPAYLFFIPPPLEKLSDFVSEQHSYIWLLWLLSQAWITVHIWRPHYQQLASTEKLFLRPMYDAFLIDQSLALNRRHDEEEEHNTVNMTAEVKELTASDLNDPKITRIYPCATMWHETEAEMMEFLKSVFRLDIDQCANRIVRYEFQYNLPSYYELETHILFDDAFIRKDEKDRDPHLNQYVLKLISLIDKAATKVHRTEVKVRPPKIYPTPYGGRLVWTLPGKTKLIAHLKDAEKIRKKKRWSQCMYMYYLLGYKLKANDDIPEEQKDLIGENTFILALDGDIDFQPEALHLLVDHMKKNRQLGAACGRIHPTGSGAMVWYQIFEYAVGHWMQKATEHVIGCVLCSPGCFSLFRGKALASDGVARKYMTRSTQPTHFVQYDQGEDRWLCTLLLQSGYRVEYSAASDAYTQCPEGFNEFFNQRRRWMPSTTANILDLLMDAEHVVKTNKDISKIYIAYQVVLMIGTTIGPGTIFLMLIGAFNAVFGLDQITSLSFNLVPVLIFIVVCATCSSDIQLFFAALISAIYGLIMMAVLIGVVLQIREDGPLAPSSMFFFLMILEFVIAAIAHPKEFYCLKYGIIYYVTVPSMYMLLVIYAVFNMNSVSWGTREVTIVPEKKPTEAETDKDKKPDNQTKTNKVLSFLGAGPNDNTGSIEFSLNKLFKCMFCTYKGDDIENDQLKRIQESLDKLAKKLDRLENISNDDGGDGASENIDKNDKPKPIVIEGPLSNNSDDVIENSWLYDGDLIRGETDFLTNHEETFWNKLIENYLNPVEDYDEKVAKELKDLRDKIVFTFFMLNSLFVLVIFLLTLKQDVIHLNWPFAPKTNFTYFNKKNEFQLQHTYLKLEPIGFVFLIFFGIIMGVQGMGMFVHRFKTFSHIIAHTRLEFDLFTKKVENMTRDDLISRDPLKVALQLQELKGINNVYEDDADKPAYARPTFGGFLKSQPDRKSTQTFDLEKAFEQRIKGKVEEKNPDSRKSIALVLQRKKSLDCRQSRLIPTSEQDASVA